jgi:hypothetical protein
LSVLQLVTVYDQALEDKDLQDASVNDLAIAYAWLAITRRDNDEVTAYSELDGILSSALQMWTTVVNKLSVPSSKLLKRSPFTSKTQTPLDSEDKEVLEENKKYFGSLEKTESTMSKFFATLLSGANDVI